MPAGGAVAYSFIVPRSSDLGSFVGRAVRGTFLCRSFLDHRVTFRKVATRLRRTSECPCCPRDDGVVR